MCIRDSKGSDIFCSSMKRSFVTMGSYINVRTWYLSKINQSRILPKPVQQCISQKIDLSELCYFAQVDCGTLKLSGTSSSDIMSNDTILQFGSKSWTTSLYKQIEKKREEAQRYIIHSLLPLSIHSAEQILISILDSRRFPTATATRRKSKQYITFYCCCRQCDRPSSS
eukprot:TRINITY_DN1447_c0_g1_i4.p1 TRINITY_DN1447_c0_g1~~TRINITY_DN1447_c0_g1_i4.p1  ORF type:complete len:169 (-),score=4.63 TRINITY_DN1447_c0_g1_i4:169-675(-)